MNSVRKFSGKIRDAAKRFHWLGVIVGLGFGVMQPSGVWAQGAGDLVVSPTRVVLEGRTRTAQLTLLNRGSASATYRIAAVNMRMEEDGTVREIEKADPGQSFANGLFRYSPRQVTLKPGAAQAIRILLRKPKDLKDGEYRSHMLFQGVPQEAGESVEQGAADGIAVKMIPIYGISIPVIIRHGKTAADVSLSDLKLLAKDDANPLPRLKFQINRKGNRSAFGDLIATYKSGSESTVIGQIRRLAIYTPNTHRSVEMRLRVPNGTKLSGGTIHLSYTKTADDGGKLMSETEFMVP